MALIGQKPNIILQILFIGGSLLVQIILFTLIQIHGFMFHIFIPSIKTINYLIKRTIPFLLYSLLLCGCEVFSIADPLDPYYLLQLYNNSLINIISYQASGSEAQPTMYPDTLLPTSYYENMDVNECIVSSDSGIIIKPGSLYPLLPYSYPKISERRFNRHFRSGIYSIFIFDAETAQEKNWEDIRKDYDILVRYDLTFDDLKALKDTIPFPPTEEMKDMQMYPPYGEVVKKYR